MRVEQTQKVHILRKVIKREKELVKYGILWLTFVCPFALIFCCKLPQIICFCFFCMLLFISEHWKVNHIETSFSLTLSKDAAEFFWHAPLPSHIIFQLKKDFDRVNSIKLYFWLIRSGTLEQEYEGGSYTSPLKPMPPGQHLQKRAQGRRMEIAPSSTK